MLKTQKHNNFQPVVILPRYYLYVSFFDTRGFWNTSQYQPVLGAAVPSLHIKYVGNLMTWHVYVFMRPLLYTMLQITDSHVIPGYSDFISARSTLQCTVLFTEYTNN